jgi:hypothetical protein
LSRLANRAAAQPRAATTVVSTRLGLLAARLLQRLVRRRPRLYIEGMNVAFDLPPAQAEKLRQVAERLGMAPCELARAAVTDLLADRDDDFRAAADRILRKNAELYRRLA